MAARRQLLIIAGPAGAGKSTFMRELSQGRLSPEIAEELPAGSDSWPRITANDIDSRGFDCLSPRSKGVGLVLHYNTMRPHSKGFGSYASDPALRALNGFASCTTVATLVLAPTQLLKQYRARLAEGNTQEWWVAASQFRALRLSVRTLIGAQPRRLMASKRNQSHLIDLYETPARLAEWSARWAAYLEDLRQRWPNVALLFVSPCGASADHPRFSLLQSDKKTSS
jgi:hypothetical protein